MGLLRAHRQGPGTGRTTKGICRGGKKPEYSPMADYVAAHTAQLPAAFDCDRHLAGCACDYIGGNHEFPGAGRARDRTFIGIINCQRLSIHAFGAVLDQPVSRRSAADYHCGAESGGRSPAGNFQSAETAMSTMPLLQVRDLRTHFMSRAGQVPAVDGVSLQLESGRILGLVGESG